MKLTLNKILIGIFGIICLLLGLKSKQLKRMQMKQKTDEMDRDLEKLRQELNSKEKRTEDAEKLFKQKELELRRARRTLERDPK